MLITNETHDNIREPDNIIRNKRDGTTYTVREYMVGNEPVADIIVRRIIRELEPDFPMIYMNEYER
jgi:hypothetical protein